MCALNVVNVYEQDTNTTENVVKKHFVLSVVQKC